MQTISPLISKLRKIPVSEGDVHNLRKLTECIREQTDGQTFGKLLFLTRLIDLV